MQKQAPSIPRIAAMVVFASSCFGVLLFLWLTFGGAIPLKPQGYRFEAAFPEATTLAREADVRLAGVNIGKVRSLKMGPRGRTLVVMELEREYAPIRRDTKAILRQKTLLGETYVELTPGDRDAPALPDGARLADENIQPTVEIDEVLGAFDRPTRTSFQTWLDELDGALRGGRGQSLNAALGNLPGAADETTDLMSVLDSHRDAVRLLIRNSGEVFAALNEREGALADLVRSSNDVFEATASRDDALAETMTIFPTFLDESKATMTRLQKFSTDTRPLVRDLKPVADDLGPTVRDVGRLAPDLRDLFGDLDALTTASKDSLPRLEQVLAGARPLLADVYPLLEELNPILSYANFDRAKLALFIVTGGATLNGGILSDPHDGKTVPERYVRGFGIINSSGLETMRDASEVPPEYTGNTYPDPNAYTRALTRGAIESFTCRQTGLPGNGERPNSAPGLPPCLVKPPSLYDGRMYPNVLRGDDKLREPPR
jgi:phospholipid/cholesterol/gamma-HCH transport system substrate-binding protein